MNPFAPPTARVDSVENSTVFMPRIFPKDGWDFLIVLLVTIPFQVVPLFGGVALLAYLITGSPPYAFLALSIFYIVLLLFSVRSICVQPDGIAFRRFLGTPKFISWQEMRSIRIATRLETIRDGWLWPLFPARDMSFGMSAKDHVRIEWKSGFCFFPPRDVEGFFEAVGKYASSLA